MLTRLFAALRGFIYATAFVFTWWWVVAFMRPLDVRFGFSMPEWLRIPGIVIAILGALISLSCISVFAFFGKGTPAPFDAPREFVAVGPYKFVRNPMKSQHLNANLVTLTSITNNLCTAGYPDELYSSSGECR
jgi:protein-S-isoprenylcysteine O-methyltransferase Ste14